MNSSQSRGNKSFAQRHPILSVVAVIAAAWFLVSKAWGFVAGDFTAVVERVIDGDTITVLYEGEEVTVRLLNIDTPETKHPDMPVQCLGPEATQWLTKRLPTGTKVTLEFDEERRDRYDRLLAGVYEAGSLVNAEIAREGLGVPVYFEPNRRFLGEVEDAWDEAVKAERGLNARLKECTIPGQRLAATQKLQSLQSQPLSDPTAHLEALFGLQEEVFVLGAALEADLPSVGHAVWDAPEVEDTLQRYRDEYRKMKEDFDKPIKAAKDAVEKQKQEEARNEQVRLEAERREKERQAEEQREKEQAEREQKAAEQKKAPRSSTSPAPKKPKSSSSGKERFTAPKQDKQAPKKSAPKKSAPKKSAPKKKSGCTPYGPEIPYSADGGYKGKRYGMPGGKTFRKCK